MVGNKASEAESPGHIHEMEKPEVPEVRGGQSWGEGDKYNLSKQLRPAQRGPGLFFKEFGLYFTCRDEVSKVVKQKSHFEGRIVIFLKLILKNVFTYRKIKKANSTQRTETRYNHCYHFHMSTLRYLKNQYNSHTMKLAILKHTIN